MSLPTTTQVLVVGGGPTGLCLALALQKQGCPDVVVVDGVTQGENTSRAIAVHAATIEALDSIGCADVLVSHGRKVAKTNVWFGPSPVEMAYFTPLARYTKYPFILAVAQHVTERVLGTAVQERSINIYRPHKVVDMKLNEQDSTYTDVIFDNGHVLRARCIVGADGARSTVRSLANVGWADPTGEANVNSKDEDDLSNMIIADVTLTDPPPLQSDAINLITGLNNAFLFIYLPKDSYPDAGLPTDQPVYRVACAIPPALGTPPHAPDTPYLQKLLDAWGPNTVLPVGTPRVQVSRTVWSSRFRTHSAIADRFLTHLGDKVPGAEPRGGLVLLIGDAAHIHPPMGGQGMNLGIRDGIRLAPILAEYVRTAAAHGSAGLEATADVGPALDKLEGPLRAWAEERRGRALTVIKMVKDLQGMMWVPSKTQWLLGIIPYNRVWLRNAFLRIVTTFEWWRASAAYRVSGLGNP